MNIAPTHLLKSQGRSMTPPRVSGRVEVMNS
jgi:hypothetical protein